MDIRVSGHQVDTGGVEEQHGGRVHVQELHRLIQQLGQELIEVEVSERDVGELDGRWLRIRYGHVRPPCRCSRP